MTIHKLATQYVREQLGIMKKYGSAPSLTREQRAVLVASVEKTFQRLKRTGEATKTVVRQAPTI
jgi:hypothetical protein